MNIATDQPLEQRLTLPQVRALCRAAGIKGGISELARIIGRSRVNVYHAIERPTRYPKTYSLICRTIL